MNEDELTGLGGHDALDDALEGALRAGEEGLSPVSLVVMDVDKLGRINETFGREMGDEALRRLSGLFRVHFEPHGQVFRDAADRFAAVLGGVSKEQAFLIAEKCREAVEGAEALSIKEQDGPALPSFSAGVSNCPDDGAKQGELTRKAQGALYRAKLGGGNRICLAKEDKMVTKTSHYTTEQLQMLSLLSRREGLGEAVLLREALDDLIKKYD